MFLHTDAASSPGHEADPGRRIGAQLWPSPTLDVLIRGTWRRRSAVTPGGRGSREFRATEVWWSSAKSLELTEVDHPLVASTSSIHVGAASTPGWKATANSLQGFRGGVHVEGEGTITGG